MGQRTYSPEELAALGALGVNIDESRFTGEDQSGSGTGQDFSQMTPAQQYAAARAAQTPVYTGSVLGSSSPENTNTRPLTPKEQSLVSQAGEPGDYKDIETNPFQDLTETVNRGSTALVQARDLGRDSGGGAIGPTGAPVHGLDYNQYGGKYGKDQVDRTFDEAEGLMQQAAAEGAEAQLGESKALEAHYKKQAESAANNAALILQRKQENAAEEMRRQQELEKQTNVYSQNLADRGAFWRNPGNVIAAIGFALMPFASDDKAIGIKLLNNAIQSDFNQRKAAADSHLGELRSNLSGYRQIARDKEAGDLLAQAESYRIAALEVQRIAAQYQGPKAQASAKAMVADLMNKFGLTKMQAIQRIYTLGVKDPRIAKAISTGSYENLMPGQAPPVASYKDGVPVSGGPGTGVVPQGTNKTTGTPGEGQEFMPGAYVARKDGSVHSGSDFEGKFGTASYKNLQSRLKDAGPMTHSLVSEVQTQARRLSGHGPGTEQYKKKYEEIWDDIQEGVRNIAADPILQKEAPKAAALQQIHRDQRAIERVFKGDQAKINDWLGSWKQNFPSTRQSWNQFWDNFSGVEPSQKKAVEQAANRYRNLLAGNIADYYHEHAGANQADKEIEMLTKVISSGSPWQQQRNHVTNQSVQTAATVKRALAAAGKKGPLSKTAYLIDQGLDLPELDSPGR